MRAQFRVRRPMYHGLAPARRADQEHVVGAGRGDLERTLGVCLAPDVGEVEVVRRGCSDGARERHRPGGTVAVQQADRVGERRRGEHVEPVDGERLGGVLHGHDERVDPLASAGQPDRERATDRLDLAVERELADDGVRSDDAIFHDARGGEDTEGDRQVERRALLPDVGGRQVHGDPVQGEGETGVADRGAHALAALAHGGVRQAHRGEGRQAGRDVHFDTHERRFHADERCREHARDHAMIVRRCPRRVNVASSILWPGCRRPNPRDGVRPATGSAGGGGSRAAPAERRSPSA